MTDTKYNDKNHEYVRLALPLMSRHEIPITPKNYTVWYTHVSGECGDLSEVINGIIERKEVFDAEINEKLYNQFCIEKNEDELRRFREGLQQILDTILREVMEITGQTERYETAVSKSITRLSEGVSNEGLSDIIREIINETKAMGSHGKDIQQKLRETTDDLNVIRKEFEEVKSLSLIDFLTGAPNRKALNEKFTEYAAEAVPGSQDLALLLLDIDHFKQFNDSYGHLVGDDVLKFVSRKIKDIVRGRDFFARFGGEEFAVLLPQTPLQGAEKVAENIRRFFSDSPIKTLSGSVKLGNITISIGVTCYRADESFEELIFRADKALYCAKETGRNRVICG